MIQRFLVFAVLCAMSVSASASASTTAPAPTFQCWADWFQQNNKKNGHTDLKPSSDDPLFYDGQLLNYGLGVDTYSLKDNTITMVMVDNNTHRSVLTTAALRKIANSNVQTAEIIWLEPMSDGSKLQLSIDCSF